MKIHDFKEIYCRTMNDFFSIGDDLTLLRFLLMNFKDNLNITLVNISEFFTLLLKSYVSNFN